MTPNPVSDDPSLNKNSREVCEPKTRPTLARIAAWDFAGRLANFAVTFVVGVLITRLLTPFEFGAFAVVLAIVSFSSIFIDFGFRAAIIQQQDTSRTQLSTVFFLNLALGAILIAIFIAVSGVIESFYSIPDLSWYVSVTSLLFGINAAALVPGGLLQKELQLRTISIINTLAAALSGIVAVILAIMGFGVWSLVAQQLISASFIMTGSFIASRWTPTLSFDLSSIRELSHYGIRIFAGGFSDTVFSRLDVFVIGKLFPIQSLGFYNRAQSLDGLIRGFGAGTTVSVAFPVIARMQDDTVSVRDFYLRCLNLISFLSFGMIGVLFISCFDIVVILFTESWFEVGHYFRIMSVTAFVYPVSALMVNLIAARGNSGAFLRLEILKKTLLFPTYLGLFLGGIFTFLICLGIAFLLALLLNARFVKEEIGAAIGTQMWALYKYALIAVPATALVFVASSALTNPYLHLAVVGVTYGSLYLILCYTFNLSGCVEVFDRLAGFVNAKRNPNVPPAA